MAVMPNDSNMKRSDIEFQFSENVAAVKWFDNCGVTEKNGRTFRTRPAEVRAFLGVKGLSHLLSVSTSKSLKLIQKYSPLLPMMVSKLHL